MAYLPGQPWDPARSYNPQETCTYNGFTYTWSPYWRKSNAGKTPVDDEVPFMPIPGYAPSTARRVLRGWTLVNWLSPKQPPAAYPYYEDPVRVFERVRGLPSQSVAWYVEPRIGSPSGEPLNGFYLAYFRTLQFLTAEGPVTSDNAKFYYDTPMWGGPNVPTCIEIEPKDKVKIKKAYIELGGSGYSINLQAFTKTYYGMHDGIPCGPGKANTEFAFKIGNTTYNSENNYDCLQFFGRTYNYKYKLQFTNVKTSESNVQEYTGSVDSGPFRDEFQIVPVLSPHEDVIPEDCTVIFAGVEITSVTPDFDS